MLNNLLNSTPKMFFFKFSQDGDNLVGLIRLNTSFNNVVITHFYLHKHLLQGQLNDLLNPVLILALKGKSRALKRSNFEGRKVTLGLFRKVTRGLWK